MKIFSLCNPREQISRNGSRKNAEGKVLSSRKHTLLKWREVRIIGKKTKTLGGHLSNSSFHCFAIKATRHYGGLILTVFELMKGLNTTHKVHNDPPV